MDPTIYIVLNLLHLRNIYDIPTCSKHAKYADVQFKLADLLNVVLGYCSVIRLRCTSLMLVGLSII